MIKLCLFVIMPLFTYGQSCYDAYADAKYLSQFDDYKDLADSILDKEILNGTKNFNIYLLKSKLEYNKGNVEKGFNFLTKAVIYGCNIKHHIFTNKQMGSFVSSSDSLVILQLAQKNIEFPWAATNKMALEALYELVHWDQALTNFTVRYRDSLGISTSQVRQFELKMTRKLLRKYLKNYSYPDEKEFGPGLVDRFDLLIVHHFQEVDSCEWLKPFYDEAYKNNIISPQRYFEFYDKFSVYKKLPQRYGTFISGKKNNGRYEVYPIEDIENIDALRTELCLSPLHVFLKNNGFDLPDGYNFDWKQYINSVRYRLKRGTK